MKYDCIIIGAGIGGLTCAARLAKGGLKVLLVEKVNHAGGTATVFHRSGYSFPTGPFSFSYPSYVSNTLKELGIKEEINFKRSHFQYKSQDIDIILSSPFNQLTGELKKYFPREENGIRSFFEVMKKLIDVQDKRWEWDPDLLEGIKKEGAIKNPVNNLDERFAIIKKYQEISAENLAEEFVKDRFLRSLLANQSFEEGAMSALLASQAWNIMCEAGIWYPDVGFKGLNNLISRAIYENNGEIRFSSPVAQIIVENNRVKGIKLASGENIFSDIVVSSLDYRLTFLEMIGESFFSPDFVKWVESLKDSGSIFCVYLGVDSSKVDLSVFKAEHLFYRARMRPVTSWDEGISSKDFFMDREYEICHWSGKDKTLVPPGKDALIIRVNAPYQYFKRWLDEKEGREKGYYEYKRRAAKYLIEAVETIIPGLSSAVEVMDASTPLTYKTWGGGSEGACAGWSWDRTDEMGSTMKSLVRTPFPNLYMAGYQAFSQLFMGGFATAIHSGNLIAEVILEG